MNEESSKEETARRHRGGAEFQISLPSSSCGTTHWYALDGCNVDAEAACFVPMSCFVRSPHFRAGILFRR